MNESVPSTFKLKRLEVMQSILLIVQSKHETHFKRWISYADAINGCRFNPRL